MSERLALRNLPAKEQKRADLSKTEVMDVGFQSWRHQGLRRDYSKRGERARDLLRRNATFLTTGMKYLTLETQWRYSFWLMF